MSREFCLRQTKKEDLIKIVLSQDEIIDSFNKDISGELLMRNIAALQSENERLKKAVNEPEKIWNNNLLKIKTLACDRLKALFEEESCYYHICGSEKKLDPNNSVRYNDYMCTIVGINDISFNKILDKFMTEGAAETPWQKLMYAVKPVKFEPPMWEDLAAKVEELKASKAEIHYHEVITFNKKDDVYGVYLIKSEDDFTIEITKNDSVSEYLYGLSEEGYIEAISRARKIFVGEE